MRTRSGASAATAGWAAATLRKQIKQADPNNPNNLTGPPEVPQLGERSHDARLKVLRIMVLSH